jgi:hypothetical protein
MLLRLIFISFFNKKKQQLKYDVINKFCLILNEKK